MEDAPRSGRPIIADEDKIKVLVYADCHIATREISEKLELSNFIVHDHLKGLGCVSKLDTRVSHKLEEIDLVRRITICDSLLITCSIDCKDGYSLKEGNALYV